MKRQLLCMMLSAFAGVIPFKTLSNSTTAMPSQNTTMFLNAFGNPYVTEQNLIDFLSMPTVDIHATNNAGQTTLMLAAQYNYETLTPLLIKNNISPNATDYNKRTALMFAAGQVNTNNVNALIAAGAKVHVKDAHGKTALDYAKNNNANISFANRTNPFNKNNSLAQNQAIALQVMLQQKALKQGQATDVTILENHKQ